MKEERRQQLKEEMKEAKYIEEECGIVAFEAGEIGNIAVANKMRMKQKKYLGRYNFLKSSQKIWEDK